MFQPELEVCSDDLQRLEPVPLQKSLGAVLGDFLLGLPEAPVIFSCELEEEPFALSRKHLIRADPPAIGVYRVIRPLCQLVIPIHHRPA